MTAGEREVAPGVDHAEETDMAEHLEALRHALEAGQAGAGRLLGLPELDGDVWLDMAGAAAVSGCQPRTITAWLTRRGPKRNPFPQAHRFLYRLYWPMGVVTEWRAAEDELQHAEK